MKKIKKHSHNWPGPNIGRFSYCPSSHGYCIVCEKIVKITNYKDESSDITKLKKRVAELEEAFKVHAEGRTILDKDGCYTGYKFGRGKL